MTKSNHSSTNSDRPDKKLFLLGNEAIARGAIEAGVQVVAAYPGTPSSEITESILSVAGQHGIYVEWSVNEKVAFEVALAASMCGVRALAVMKHVGVNVAHDPLMTASYMRLNGGLVLVSADDPGQWSSQNEQDNRYIAQQGYIPVLEPSSVQEAKDMTADAFRLSEEFNQIFMLRSVTRLAHARSDVFLGDSPKNKKSRLGSFEKDPKRWVFMPANSRKSRQLLVERIARIKNAVNTFPYNLLELSDNAKLGIISSGISYSYALEALKWLGLEDKVSLLKIGTPYPLPEKLTKKLLNSVSEVLVIEELEPFVENHVKVIAQEADIRVKIHGKDFVPLIGELSTRQVVEAINKFTNSKPPIDFKALDKLREETAPLLPIRPPALCPGCPHRASYYVINAASQRIRSKNGIEPIFPGDIGCYGLGANPPLDSDDIAICMGGSFGIANGLAHVTEAPIVAHLGDSTFFHSGIPPMINAVHSGANITMMVLDNATTAMTGFQPHPGSGHPISGNQSVKIWPEEIARACGVKFVEVADPFDSQNAIDTVEGAIEFEGASLVVLRRPCAILDQRDKKKRGESVFPYHIDQDKCIEGSQPFCQAACPLHIDVRGYVGLIREERFEEAFRLVKQKLPFPGILGRVCTRPCEKKCKRGDVDEPISIAALHRSAADHGKESSEDLVIGKLKKEKIAIIGGGPAGIMAAHDLKKMGYQTTIFESLPVLGGMLSVGIPEYRLPKAVLQQEMSLIEKLGVEVRLNTKIGRDIMLSDLRRDFDAVFVATGAHKGLGLPIENGDNDGVLDGIEFLRKANLEEETGVKAKVIIVGGGMVATDCSRTCLRLGFKDVEILYRRSKTEMPAIKDEVEQAEKEGVKIHFLSAPKKILVKDGKITGIECFRVRLGDPDSSGRKRPIPIEGSEYVLRTDLIISAIGGQPDLGFLREGGESLSIANDLIKADPVTLETNVPGVFAGGDIVTGPWTVIDALAAGRKAAISIDRFLRGKPLGIDRETESVQTSHLMMDIEGIGHERRISMPTLSEDQRCGNFHEVELGFSRKEASKESERCLSCECHMCTKFLGCPALIQDQGPAKIDSSQCPGCGICAQVCPNEAIISGENDVNVKRT